LQFATAGREKFVAAPGDVFHPLGRASDLDRARAVERAAGVDHLPPQWCANFALPVVLPDWRPTNNERGQPHALGYSQ